MNKLHIVIRSTKYSLSYATSYSAGLDLKSTEDLLLAPGEYKLISTGVYLVDIPSHIEGQVRSRSGLAAKHGICVLNSPGTIDPDYKGEIKIILINHSKVAYQVSDGDKIAQLVFSEFCRPNLALVEDKSRGDGGFGSTGI